MNMKYNKKSILRNLLAFLILGILVGTYQNCSKSSDDTTGSSFSKPPPPPPPPTPTKTSLPFFASQASSGSLVAGVRVQSVARIINLSGHSGSVKIYAIDDRGTRFGPASLNLPAGRTIYFNTTDLEQGNSSKGLSGGVGSQGQGSWRLELETTLKIKALAYIRNRKKSDDSVFSLQSFYKSHRGQRVSIDAFQSGGNTSFSSQLRLINPGLSAINVKITGIDDLGQPGAEAVHIRLPAGSAQTLTGQELEAGNPSRFRGQLGDGAVKWRLSLSSTQPMEVMNLIRSSTGLSNFFGLTKKMTRGGTSLYTLPFFASQASSGSLVAGVRVQSVARIINLSGHSGSVKIYAIDDRGTRFGPASLNLPAGRTIYFNTTDLEQGNSSKGLSGGVGSQGQGSWRLELETTLKIKALAYIRNRKKSDDSVFSLQSFYKSHRGQRVSIDAFQSGGNTSFSSQLRLINPGLSAINVKITGIDDLGQPGAEAVHIRLPAGSAQTLTGQELEAGNPSRFRGQLGDGAVKWRLSLSSTQPMEVMNLIRSSTGLSAF